MGKKQSKQVLIGGLSTLIIGGGMIATDQLLIQSGYALPMISMMQPVTRVSDKDPKLEYQDKHVSAGTKETRVEIKGNIISTETPVDYIIHHDTSGSVSDVQGTIDSTVAHLESLIQPPSRILVHNKDGVSNATSEAINKYDPSSGHSLALLSFSDGYDGGESSYKEWADFGNKYNAPVYNIIFGSDNGYGTQGEATCINSSSANLNAIVEQLKQKATRVEYKPFVIKMNPSNKHVKIATAEMVTPDNKKIPLTVKPDGTVDTKYTPNQDGVFYFNYTYTGEAVEPTTITATVHGGENGSTELLNETVTLPFAGATNITLHKGDILDDKDIIAKLKLPSDQSAEVLSKPDIKTVGMFSAKVKVTSQDGLSGTISVPVKVLERIPSPMIKEVFVPKALGTFTTHTGTSISNDKILSLLPKHDNTQYEIIGALPNTSIPEYTLIEIIAKNADGSKAKTRVPVNIYKTSSFLMQVNSEVSDKALLNLINVKPNNNIQTKISVDKYSPKKFGTEYIKAQIINPDTTGKDIDLRIDAVMFEPYYIMEHNKATVNELLSKVYASSDVNKSILDTNQNATSIKMPVKDQSIIAGVPGEYMIPVQFIQPDGTRTVLEQKVIVLQRATVNKTPINVLEKSEQGAASLKDNVLSKIKLPENATIEVKSLPDINEGSKIVNAVVEVTYTITGDKETFEIPVNILKRATANTTPIEVLEKSRKDSATLEDRVLKRVSLPENVTSKIIKLPSIEKGNTQDNAIVEVTYTITGDKETFEIPVKVLERASIINSVDTLENLPPALKTVLDQIKLPADAKIVNQIIKEKTYSWDKGSPEAIVTVQYKTGETEDFNIIINAHQRAIQHNGALLVPYQGKQLTSEQVLSKLWLPDGATPKIIDNKINTEDLKTEYQYVIVDVSYKLDPKIIDRFKIPVKILPPEPIVDAEQVQEILPKTGDISIIGSIITVIIAFTVLVTGYIRKRINN